jgi:hypothetical protein
VFVVHQPDGTLAQIPCWMMSESAARHELRAEPRLPLEHLRNLRVELDLRQLLWYTMQNFLAAPIPVAS